MPWVGGRGDCEEAMKKGVVVAAVVQKEVKRWGGGGGCRGGSWRERRRGCRMWPWRWRK